MNKLTRNILLPGAALLLLVLLSYVFLIRDLVIQAYQGTAPDWFNYLIQLLYPRFEIEKHRFPIQFFLSKTDQILFRVFLIGAIIFTISYLFNSSEKIRIRTHEFWNRRTSIENTNILRILFFLFLIIIFHDIYLDLMRLESAKVFYRPITPFRVLNIPFPTEAGVLIITILFFLTSALAMLNILPVLSSALAVIVFIFIQGLIFSFEKYDHGFATFTYAGLLLPFLLFEKKLALQKKLNLQSAWPLQLIICCICLSYFYTGMEKLLISGIDWINGNSLKSHLSAHGIPAGKMIAKKFWLLILLANLTLFTQIGFISILFNDKLKFFFIPAAFLFHLSVSWFLGIGGILNPWILSYIFFFDWSWIYRKLLPVK